MTAKYFLGDALGSVKKLIDGSEDVVLAKDYEPYGEVMTIYSMTNHGWNEQRAGFVSGKSSTSNHIYIVGLKAMNRIT